MKHLAVYLLLKLGGNDAPSKDDITKAMESVGITADDERLSAMMAELEGKDVNELVETGSAMLAKFGGGGGGAGGDAGGAEEAAKEEEVEEEEAPAATGMFGDDGGKFETRKERILYCARQCLLHLFLVLLLQVVLTAVDRIRKRWRSVRSKKRVEGWERMGMSRMNRPTVQSDESKMVAQRNIT